MVLPDEDSEAGVPLGLLDTLDVQPSRRFRAGLRRRIERRRIAVDLSAFFWSAPAVIAVEVLRAAFIRRPKPKSEEDK